MPRPQEDTTPKGREWTPGEIGDLRGRLGLNQTDFGLRIFDSTAASAQRKVSQLEAGDYGPSAAVRKHLERLEEQAEEQDTDNQ